MKGVGVEYSPLNYFVKYAGTCLIVGSAPCAREDYNLCSKFRPNARVIAVNDAVRIVYADFAVSLHTETMWKFRADSLNATIITMSGQRYNPTHDIDYWFDGCNSGGTSTGSAIKIAIKLGFTEIILCGCPLIGGDGYFDDVNSSGMSNSKRVGHMKKEHPAHMRHLSNLSFESKKYPEGVKVKSVCGKTAEMFGKPLFI